MSRIYKAPARSASATSAARQQVTDTVAAIIEDVRQNGDNAVRRYAEKFDGTAPASFLLTQEDIAAAVRQVPGTVLDDVTFVQQQVRTFAQAQRDSLTDVEVETLPGVHLGQRHIPVSAAGAYVPGGRYPLLASAHMTIVTAKVACVPRVAACTPPIHGELPAASIAAMHLAGADEIYLFGGAQAIAALAVGTESIDPVHILTGPGNAYVAEAKRQLFGEVGIDLFAGPTETLIIADDTADPFMVAVDLLSQAEHGPDSPAVLITTSQAVAEQASQAVRELLPGMPTRDYAEPSWRDYGEIHLVDDLERAYALANEFASEHVQILTAHPRDALSKMTNYGALFLGERTTVSFGDKVIGTNHVLPTRKAARYTGGLWVGKFLKTVTYQEITDDAASARLGELCGRASRAERFEGHARSGDLRAARFGSARLPWVPPVSQLA
jgi:sulfopropanediol 3-dehydrogenase